MRIDVLSLFPELIENYANTSILKIARDKGLYSLHTHNPRDYSLDKHKKVDNTVYGGGAGMLLMPQPYIDCLDAVKTLQEGSMEIILTSPSGRKFSQSLALELSQKSSLIILCGRYEGFDQRIRDEATMEISVGDYVLTGGELPALTIIDATLRLIPGVLGDDTSSQSESFSEVNFLEKFKELGVTKREIAELMLSTGIKSQEEFSKLQLLEYPQYTMPSEFRGQSVPEILKSGDHKKIFLWRLEQAIKLTKKLRPDLNV